MFRLVVAFIINGITGCINVTKTFVLDRMGTINITYYNFLICMVFMTVVIKVISIMKGIQEVEEDRKNMYKALTEYDEYRQYNGWLRRHKK